MKIEPYVSVNDFIFGESQAEIRRKANSPFGESKTEIAGYSEWKDIFVELKFVAYYSSSGDAIAFEFFDPDWLLGDKHWSKMTYNEILRFFQSNFSTVEVKGDSFTCQDLGISISKSGSKRRAASGVFVYSHEYEKIPVPTPEEIIRDLLG
jgi:hypothetical protein